MNEAHLLPSDIVCVCAYVLFGAQVRSMLACRFTTRDGDVTYTLTDRRRSVATEQECSTVIDRQQRHNNEIEIDIDEAVWRCSSKYH